MCSRKMLIFAGAAALFFLALPIIVIGIIFFYGAFSAQGEPGWIGIGGTTACVGVLMIGGSIVLLWLGLRPTPGSVTQNVTLKVDLPGDVNLDTMKCKSCGGALTMDNIEMVAGAPVVSCPYCKTTYQLTEEPKW